MASPFKKIWNHESRASIEYDLARGVPPPIVARKYGVSRTAAYRLRRKLPAQLKAAKMVERLRSGAELEELRISESNNILASLAMQRAGLLITQDACMEAGDHGKVVFCAQALQRNTELVGRFLGEFAAHSIQTNISVLISPKYLELRAQLLNALKRFPEARAAVAEALHQTEARASAPMIEATAEETNASDHAA
jgi:hypothetical protein